MADKRISQLIERVDIANNDVLPIVASGATTTNKVTISTIQDWMQSNLDVGVTSVGLTMPSAFQVSGSPITTSGNINVTATGTASQYIRGDGSLADFPQGGGGGASVSYYLNGSVSQGTIGGIAYLEINKTPILGAGTDFTISSDGYIASFITDAGDPALLQIPAGNWNFETYLQASSGGGTPTFYIELYKVDSGGTATLIASNSGTPESISLGTNINPYFSAIAVPQTTLLVTDRLALRYYVSPSGRTITLHTENNTLCQIITTFTTGLTALNGLTAQVQNFATGTSGTNFGITSSGSIHTFNLPDASASARGVVTTGSQVFGGVKTFADGLSLPSAGGTNQASRFVNIGTIHQGTGGSNQIGFNNSNNIYFGKGLDNGGVIQWSNSAVRYYTLPNADGTIALTSDLGNYVTLGTAQTITGEKIFSSTLTVNTPSNGIGVLLNGRTSDNFSSIRFGANTGGGQYNAISANASSLDISSLGATPITFSTDTQGGGGTRMTISGTGAVTLTGALNGTTASFNNLVNITASGGGAAINIRGRSVDDIGQILFFDNNGSTLRNIIQSQPSTLAIYSQGNTPITFGTNNAGGGGTRMTIGGDGTITLAGALSGTSATFSGNVSAIGNSSMITVSYADIDAGNNRGLRIINTDPTEGTAYNITAGRTGQNNGDFVIRNTTTGVNNLVFNRTTGAATFSGALNGTTATFLSGSSSTIGLVVGGAGGVGSTRQGQIRFGDAGTVYKIQGGEDYSAMNFMIGSGTPLSLASNGAATFSSSVTAGGTGTFQGPNDGTALFVNRAGGASVLALNTNANGSFTLFDFAAGSFTAGITQRSGNVGIGTASPASKLDVSGEIRSTSTSGYAALLSISSLGYSILADTHTGGAMTIFTEGSEKMRITSSGNVGIGTNSPTRPLVIYNSSAATLYQTPTSGTTANDGFYVGQTSDVSYVWNYNNFPLVFGTNNTERMRITSGGNVGIGTSTFNYSVSGRGYLAINGTSNSIIEMQNNSSAAGYLFAASDNLELTAVGASRFLRFTTNDVEKMRITAVGFLKASNTGSYINSAGEYHELRSNNGAGAALVVSNTNASTPYGLAVVYGTTRNNSVDFFIECVDPSASRFLVASNGNVTNTNNSYGAISDAKLKENIEDATPKLDDLMKVKVRNYNLIGDDKKQIGVIAQELEEVFPAMIDESPDYEEVEVPQVDEEGNEILNEEGEVVTTKERVSKGTTTKSVKYSVFVPMLIKAMQEQQEQIKSLTEQVEALKSQING